MELRINRCNEFVSDRQDSFVGGCGLYSEEGIEGRIIDICNTSDELPRRSIVELIAYEVT